jgi:hypothetical protein
MKETELECHDKAIYPAPARKRNFKRVVCYCLFGAAMALFPLRAWADSDDPKRFIPRILVSSTMPANGDLNPYGVAFVPPGFPAGGSLKPGDVLVSNFNASSNLQGTGTTIIKLTPSSGAAADGTASVFFQGTTPPPLGLTMALGVLQRGFVIVGNVTTTDGKSDTVAAGPLLFIDQHGTLIKTFATNLDGPWGLALKDDFDHAKVFVSNVLRGTVTRIDVSLPNSETVNVTGTTQIASGYKHQTDTPPRSCWDRPDSFTTRGRMFSTSPRQPTMRFSRFRMPAAPVHRQEQANSSSLTLTCVVPWRWLSHRTDIC